MVIWNLSQRTLISHLIAMYMTVIRMVVYAQEIFAFGELAFSAFGGRFEFFCHRYSYLYISPSRKGVKVRCLCPGAKVF